MKTIMNTLLAADDMARLHGCGLKPALRAAIEKDLRFPAHAASPTPQDAQSLNELPENVVRLEVSQPQKQRTPA
jgi:predicted small lipoprotein YifL